MARLLVALQITVTLACAASDGAQPPPQPDRVNHSNAPSPPNNSSTTPVVPTIDYGPTENAGTAPPAISGGTLLVTKTGTAFASDPDNDRIWIVDLATRTVTSVKLGVGDEPGRIVEGESGTIYVVLRRKGTVLTIRDGAVIAERSVCPAPRGIDRDGDRLIVACAGGEVVSLPSDGATPLKSVRIDRDLRDVVFDGARTLVTTFRSAGVIELDGDLRVIGRWFPASRKTMVPAVAWRTVRHPRGGVFMVHQHHETAVLPTNPVGAPVYYTPAGCGSVVESSVTTIDGKGAVTSSFGIFGAVLPVDVAISPTASEAVVVAAGNNGTEPRSNVVFFSTTPMSDCAAGNRMTVPGDAIAVAFDALGKIIVQTRRPAGLFMMSARTSIPFDVDTPVDSGHAIFHTSTAVGIACASCHPEGSDDGHTWRFSEGPRRTQSLRGGVLATAPFHWAGDVADMKELATMVLNGRMRGPLLTGSQLTTLATWMDAIPPLPPSLGNKAAIERGRTLFEDDVVGCAKCHAGPALTNNSTADVGTSALMQVPSLRGVVHRAPYLHDGCAPTLLSRFGPCGGGDKHGKTSHLTAASVSDLIEYLESL